jgi:hypothetical protein
VYALIVENTLKCCKKSKKAITKWERNEEIKLIVVYMKGDSHTRVFSWGLGTPTGSCPWMPLLIRTAGKTSKEWWVSWKRLDKK